MKQLLKLLLACSLSVPSLMNIHANEQTYDIFNQAQEIDYQAPTPSKPMIPFTQNTPLPSSYDARALGYVTPMENQGQFGTCWSYGAISAAETSLLKQGYLKDAAKVDFSEIQVAYGFYHRKNDPFYNSASDTTQANAPGTDGYIRTGGNTLMNAMYLSQWQSVVSEEVFPNVNDYADLLEPYEYEALNQAIEPTYVMKEAIFLPEDTRAIKEAIIKYGSVVASYYSESEFDPYIYNLSNSTNHVITLVGYDDNISRENFRNSNAQGILPSRDGAWIMKNSWGTGFGEQGYFYVSYDQHLGAIAAFEYMPKENQNLYYYDGGASVSEANYPNASTITYANVFESALADTYTQEQISGVSVGIGSASTSYEIQLVRLNPNPTSPMDGTPLLTKPLTGQVQYAGIYTIPLEEAISLSQGDAISVVVTLNSSQNQPKIFVSSKANESFVNVSETNEIGQSYFLTKGDWEDCMSMYDTCARIKMITTSQTDASANETVKQNLNAYLNEYTWLSSSMKQSINEALNSNQYTVMNKMLKAIDEAKFSYDLLMKRAQEDMNEMNEWLNGKEATTAHRQQLSPLLSSLSSAMQNKANYDSLSKAYEELKETYDNIIYSLYDGYSLYEQLGLLIDELDMFQYGELSRYLTFSQLNDIYNITNTARNVYQNSYNEMEHRQQYEIVKETLSKYQTLAKQNRSGCNLLTELVHAFDDSEMDEKETLNFERRKQHALQVAQKSYPLTTYAAQYVKLNAFVRQCAFVENQPIIPEEQAPAVVKNVLVTQESYKAINLSWDASKDALSYDVYVKGYKEDSVFEFKTNVSEPATTISGLMSGKTYSFYIIAKNKVGDAQASDIVTYATQLEGEVTLAMEQVSASKFKLSWNAIDGATRYIIYRKRNDDSFKKVLTLGASEFAYTTAELPHGNYQFIVKAGRYDSKDRIMTDASNVVKGSVEEVAPTITLTASTKQIKVAWTKLEGVTHYEVYRATSLNGKYTKLKATTATSYTAKSLTSNKTYYFKVCGYKTYKSGDSISYKVYTPYSSVKNAKAR